MKKMLSFLFSAVVVALCAGCQSRQDPDPASRVVTEIRITRESNHETHCYTSQDSMNQILSYIRRLNPYGKVATGWEPVPGENFEITIFLSDGTQRTYQQNGQSYFCNSSRHWLQIDPETAEELPVLFRRLRRAAAVTQ